MCLTGWPGHGQKDRIRLKRRLRFADPIRYTAHRNEKGEAYHRHACRRGWEGVIAKDAGSAYAHKRSRKWLKFKCGNRQEFILCGFTAPQGEREEFGALLLGFYEDGKLKSAGKVGTGFDAERLAALGSKMRRLKRKTSPYDEAGRLSTDGRSVTWLKPTLVGEVGFTEWTRDGRLRHPRFLGLRDDKPAKQVRRE